MKYRVVGDDGKKVEVDAFDWMMAMVHAIEILGIEVSGWACETRPDGTVHVTDPMSNRSWTVTKAGEDLKVPTAALEGPTVAPALAGDDDVAARSVPPPLPPVSQAVVPTAPVQPVPQPMAFDALDAPERAPLDAPDRMRRVEPETSAFVPPVPEPAPSTPAPAEPAPEPVEAAPAPEPTPAMPRLSPRPRRRTPPPTATGPDPVSLLDATPRPVPRRDALSPMPPTPDPSRRARPAPSLPPTDLAEQIFERSMELSAATDGNDACRRALDICLDLVPCEAGSVLRGGLNHAHLTFAAVAGPAAETLLGRELPFGRGIVGASFDLGISITVDDVQEDPRHVSSFDEETGFRTRSVLCVPVQGREQYHGAVQLLNPTDGVFSPWQRDVVEQLAASLASTLDGVAS